ncbi:MAG: insulinase family protein, partial [Verrucomicrobia bacterium]|jgi:zinc protease|nr:insulinase family protein [Verrucomicrobiota bacterium]
VTLNSTFPVSALQREQAIQVAGIRAQKDELLKSASNAMRRALFGDTGYGLDLLGTEASVQKTKPADLKSFHAQLVAPNNCVLAIYGDVKTTAVKAAVQRAFANWKPVGRVTPCAPLFADGAPGAQRTARPTLPQRVTETRDKKQAVLVIGYAGTTLHSADRYALELLQESCSDLGSRLFLRIREKLGLAYYVGAQNFPGLAPGYFAFYVGTEPDKAELVEQELLKEAGLLRAEGVTAEELKRAKAKVIGQKKIARQDLGSFAMTTALDELYGLGYANTDAEDAKFEAVTLDQVKAAANKYLQPDALVIAVVKPDKK